MKAYSKDLRERIIGALEARAGTQPEIAERFSVSLSFVEKLWRRWRQTESCEAKPPGGGRRRALKERQPVIRAEVANYPDVTLAELCARVAQSDGVRASISMMCRELKKLKLPRKKSRFTTVSETRRE
jgi:transposase